MVLGLFAVVCLPGVALARSQGVKFFRAPEVIQENNSQTMALLESHLNTYKTPDSSAHLAIVDGSALSPMGEGVEFVDTGKSGTGQISVYIVRKGDTLPEIAQMFGVSSNTIAWANDIKGSTIKEGQELVILPISGVRHTVKKGDTLASIASKYKADMQDILAFNDVSASSILSPGDVIIVPDGEITSTASSGSTAKPKSKSSGASSSSGYFIRPIKGGRESQGIHGHNGVDLANKVGTPVMAAASGKVIISRSSGYNGGYGSYIVVSHANGTQTLYAHLSSDKVSVGQTVSQGQVIGAIGMTGKTTGPHLHFEVRGGINPF